MTTIAILSTGRQDWGILHSTAVAIRAHPDLELRLFVGGMHLSARHGHTIDDIRADGFEPDATLAWLGDDGSDTDPRAANQAASPVPGSSSTRCRASLTVRSGTSRMGEASPAGATQSNFSE